MMTKFILLSGGIAAAVALGVELFYPAQFGIWVQWLVPIGSGLAVASITRLNGLAAGKRRAAMVGAAVSAIGGVGLSAYYTVIFLQGVPEQSATGQGVRYASLSFSILFVPVVYLGLGWIGGWLGAILAPSRSVLTITVFGLILSNAIVISRGMGPGILFLIPLLTGLVAAYTRMNWDTSVKRRKAALDGALTGFLSGSLSNVILVTSIQLLMCGFPDAPCEPADYNWSFLLFMFTFYQIVWVALGYGGGLVGALLNRTPRLQSPPEEGDSGSPATQEVN